MKVELNFKRWGQALRGAIIVFILLMLQYIIIQQSIGFGWNMAIRQSSPPVERTMIPVPKPAIQIGETWLMSEY